MKKTPPAFFPARVIALIGVMLALSSRADAALIIFDFCTEPALCNKVEFQTERQPSGVIDSSFGGAGIDVLQFGINYASEIDVTFRLGAATPTALLGPGTIGPYGLFTQRWMGPPVENYQLIGITFRDPDGPLPHNLAPFFENGNGFFFGAEVRDERTGATGFVSATLTDMTPVPEPGTLLLCASGLALIARRARSRRIHH